MCLPSVYLTSLHVTKSPRPSPSIFEYYKWPETGGGNSLVTRRDHVLACTWTLIRTYICQESKGLMSSGARILHKSMYKKESGVRQDHMDCDFAWHNAKSFCGFSQWEKAALIFQWRLKSLPFVYTAPYTLLCACTGSPCSLTESIGECRLDYHTRMLESCRKSLSPCKPQHKSCY